MWRCCLAFFSSLKVICLVKISFLCLVWVNSSSKSKSITIYCTRCCIYNPMWVQHRQSWEQQSCSPSTLWQLSSSKFTCNRSADAISSWQGWASIAMNTNQNKSSVPPAEKLKCIVFKSHIICNWHLLFSQTEPDTHWFSVCHYVYVYYIYLI